MSEANVNLSLVANVWIKQLDFPTAGTVMAGHMHTFDHQTLLAKGSFRVFVDGIAREFTAPQIIVIERGEVHMLEALEDGTVAYCIHALRGSERVEDIISPDQVVDMRDTHPISLDIPNELNLLL